MCARRACATHQCTPGRSKQHWVGAAFFNPIETAQVPVSALVTKDDTPDDKVELLERQEEEDRRNIEAMRPVAEDPKGV